jgi:hypothetical protein
LKNAFALIFAILFLILVSFVSVEILSFSSETSSTTRQLYLYKQAKLFSESGIHFAKVILKNRKNNLEKISINYRGFEMVLLMKYLKSNIVLVDIFIFHKKENVSVSKQIYLKL